MKKALLISSDPSVLERERSILSNRGIELFYAASAEEGIATHSNEKIDLVICGTKASCETCSRTCQQIRDNEKLKKVSIIAIAPFAGNKEINDCLKSGANDYLQAPVDQFEFVQKISKFINTSIRRDVRTYVKLNVNNAAEGVFVGLTVNLSVSGLLLESGHSFTVGESEAFSLSIHEIGRAIQIKGVVVRKDIGSRPMMYLYGIKFIAIAEEDKKAIERYVLASK